MGVPLMQVKTWAYASGAFFGGAAGCFYGVYQGGAIPDNFKLYISTLLLAMVILGGIGNLTGATLGALIIGLIQAFNEGLSWHAPGEQWTTSIVFSILILILVFRPQGLLGQPEADRA